MGRVRVAEYAAHPEERSAHTLLMFMIYLDNNATTKPCASAVDAAQHAMAELWSNPSSVHRSGQDTRQAIEIARARVARLLSVKPRDLTFTAGATESIDLALRGVIDSVAGTRRVIVTSPIEHEAVRETCSSLADAGVAEIVHLDVSDQGVVSTDHLQEILEDRSAEVALVSVQWANNETGSIQPVQRVGTLCRDHSVLFHTDATQAVGKLPIHLDTGPERTAFIPSMGDPSADVSAVDPKHVVPVDLLSCSAHKFHGVKGAGTLFARRGVRVIPQTRGTQERGRRGGTEAVPAILAMGAAAEEAMDFVSSPDCAERIASYRDYFEQRVTQLNQSPQINCPSPPFGRLCNTTNIAFPSLEAEIILLALSERGIAASAGAACSSGSLDPSPSLLAIGIPEHLAHGSVRFSLSKHTTREELDRAASVLSDVVTKLTK